MRKIFCFVSLFALLFSLVPSVPAAQAQTDIALSVGADESQLQITWYAADSEPGYVLLAPRAALRNQSMPADALSFPSTAGETNEDGYYSHKAKLLGLEAGTEYAYCLVNGSQRSELMYFTTAEAGAFSFAFVGDPQLGAGDDLNEDTAGWANTLQAIDTHEAFSDTAFLLIAGDHVNSKSNEEQFDALLHHDTLRSLPMANVIGNHESGSDSFAQHFYRPNESTEYGVTDAGGNAYFIYHNVLFLLLNSNDRETAEHRAFMESAISAHPEADWQIVAMHHSLYTVASHAYDSKILSRREELVPVFEELGIDVALMGHDHVYCRSYLMDGLSALDDPDLYDRRDYSSVTNPTGILYLTANSSSGSKTYKPKDDVFPYSAAQHQFHVGEASKITVTEDSLSLCTYRTDDMSLLDSFTIYRTDETPHPFADVSQEDWYHRAVQYAHTHGTMNGTASTAFSPNEPTTRGMLVTVLHRLDGTPDSGPSAFTDVPAEAYYAEAVAWAAEHGIVQGVDSAHFAPEEPITRQQLLTMMVRYAAYRGRSTSAEDYASSYLDADDIAPYALASMNWGLQEGLTVGTGHGLLEPQATATRAQVAQILMRLQKLLAEPA